MKSFFTLSVAAWWVAACHTPTYYRDVEPIIQTKCGACHSAGGIAELAWSDYGAVKAHAQEIKASVASRSMPPWPPSDLGLPLAHSRALSDAEVKTVTDWVVAGAPAGSRADHRERQPTLPAISPDLEVAMSAPYTPGALADDYRCFIIDPQTLDDQYVVGHDIVPGTPATVHHVILFVLPGDPANVATLQALDDADPGPGYACFGGPLASASGQGGLRFLGGWAPGTGATPYPAGTGLALPARAKVIMQVHYNTTNGRAPDVTKARLALAKGPVTEAFVVPVVNDTFVIPAGASEATFTQKLTIPATFPALRIHAVYPHMHLLGTQIRVSYTHVTNGAAAEQTIIDIPTWDFHWQGQYTLEKAVTIAPGDALTLTCRYDNSAAHQPEVDGVRQTPREVRWGEGTRDEMCISFFYVTR